jgi:hypothetical protein
MELLVERVSPVVAEVIEKPTDFQPIRGFKPWSVKQRELEAAERAKANEALSKAASPDSEIVRLEELVLGEK